MCVVIVIIIQCQVVGTSKLLNGLQTGHKDGMTVSSKSEARWQTGGFQSNFTVGQGGCTLPVTTRNVDCHLLREVPRLDPYQLREQREEGLVPDRIDMTNCTAGRGDEISGGAASVLRLVRVAEPTSVGHSGTRVLCLVSTNGANHDDNLEAVRSTWGWRCHGFLAFSDTMDLNRSAVVAPVPEGRAPAWQSVRSMWRYISYHYASEFDWFLSVNDDAMVIVENLVAYLGRPGLQAQRASGSGTYLGFRLVAPNPDFPGPYNSGGAGYVLDRAALHKMMTCMDAEDGCGAAIMAHDLAEDMALGSSLHAAGVFAYEARDELHRNRFHPFSPETIPASDGRDWLGEYTKKNEHAKFGLEDISPETVTFDGLHDSALLFAHRYLYYCLHAPSTPVVAGLSTT